MYKVSLECTTFKGIPTWCALLRLGVSEFNECAWSGVCACVVLEISSMNACLGGRRNVRVVLSSSSMKSEVGARVVLISSSMNAAIEAPVLGGPESVRVCVSQQQQLLACCPQTQVVGPRVRIGRRTHPDRAGVVVAGGAPAFVRTAFRCPSAHWRRHSRVCELLLACVMASPVECWRLNLPCAAQAASHSKRLHRARRLDGPQMARRTSARNTAFKLRRRASGLHRSRRATATATTSGNR